MTRDEHQESETTPTQKSGSTTSQQSKSEEDGTSLMAWGGLAVIFIMEFIGLLLIINGNPLLSMLVVASPFVALLLYTDGNIEALKNLPDTIEKFQQQEKLAESKPQQTCQSCGWQNPKQNNFCHDCGSELSNSA